jgi:hypothetical protein
VFDLGPQVRQRSTYKWVNAHNEKASSLAEKGKWAADKRRLTQISLSFASAFPHPAGASAMANRSFAVVAAKLL